MAVMVADGELVYVHCGTFSGSATSLLQAFRSRVRVIDFDLMALSRRPSFLPARLKALWEAAGNGRRVPWAKTAAWSIEAQRAVTRAGLIDQQTPILFVQTLPAFVLKPTTRYSIYTDRVSREGATGRGLYTSRASVHWIKREQAFLRGAQRVYVMGPSTKEVLARDYGVPASKVVVVGAGPNMPLGPPRESESCHRLIFVGTSWELKGGPELLAAFSEVRRDFPSIELLLVGSHPGGSLPEGVTAVGPVPHAQMDALYSQADALVIPTHLEAFGISFVEGLIKGLPCIGTTVGNQPWIIGDAGECVEPGRVDALSTAIRRLVANYPAYRRRAHERGRELRQRFRWENVAAVIIEDLL